MDSNWTDELLLLRVMKSAALNSPTCICWARGYWSYGIELHKIIDPPDSILSYWEKEKKHGGSLFVPLSDHGTQQHRTWYIMVYPFCPMTAVQVWFMGILNSHHSSRSLRNNNAMGWAAAAAKRFSGGERRWANGWMSIPVRLSELCLPMFYWHIIDETWTSTAHISWLCVCVIYCVMISAFLRYTSRYIYI